MIDVLAVSAHPDDIEAGCGGFLLQAHRNGLHTGIIICTRGESGGFASAETRMAEAEAGAKALHVDYFQQLDFPDAGVEVNTANMERLIPFIQMCAPRTVITLHSTDYHPDHQAVSLLVDKTIFVSGLKKYSADESTGHPVHILYFAGDRRTNRKQPDMILAIDDVWQEKLHAIDAHKSQHVLGYKKHVIQRSLQYGALGGTRYGEGFYFKQPLMITDIRILFPARKG